MADTSKWSVDDTTAALKEGWNLFVHRQGKKLIYGIGREYSDLTFKTNVEAVKFVEHQATAHAKKAQQLHGKEV